MQLKIKNWLKLDRETSPTQSAQFQKSFYNIATILFSHSLEIKAMQSNEECRLVKYGSQLIDNYGVDIILQFLLKEDLQTQEFILNL